MSPRTIARSLPLVLLLWASAASAQLCPGVTDPCVIADNTNVASGTVLDIGERGLVIAASKTLNVQGAGILTVFAGSLTLEDGAKIVASGGLVTVFTSGPVTMHPNSQVNVDSGSAGGSFDVTADTGDIVMNGRILARGTQRQAFGGDVSLTALGGNVQVGGLGIDTTGGDLVAGGGSLQLDALGDISIAGPIRSKGSDGGFINVFAGGDVNVPSGTVITLDGNDVDFGDGGDFDVEAGGNIVFAGKLSSNASGSGVENGGGDGGFIDMLAFGDIVLTGVIEAKGLADGGGGALDLDGVNLDIGGTVALTGPGQGDGGDVFFLSTENITIRGVLDVRAGISGGSFSFGGTIDLISDGDIDLVSTAVLQTTGTFQAGTTDFFGCNVTIANGALIESLGPATGFSGSNSVQASGLATIGGVVKATTANRLRYREFEPIVAPQAGTAPAWEVLENGALPCCIGCPTTTTTSTTTSTSSTSTSTTSTSSTSTSSTSSTSTTLPGATTTTSTTIVPTTTSTLPTTTSTLATTTSSTTSTVVTTTSTIASTTTTVSSSSTTSTVVPTTSSTVTTLVTTTTIDPSTTTTTLPSTCEEQSLQGFEAAACALGVLDEDVSVLSDDDLGGKRPARGLRKRIGKSVEFLERASVETEAKKTRRFVKRSRKKLQSFEKKVVRFGSKGKIQLTLAEALLDAAEQASLQIEAIETQLSQQ